VNQEEQYELATRWTRLVAFIIDFSIIVLVSVALLYFFQLLEPMQTAKVNEPILHGIVIFIASFSAFVIVNQKLLLEQGQTVGKKIMKIKILNDNNEVPNKTDFIKRYLFMFAVNQAPGIIADIGLINYLFIFRKDRKCVHDMLAKTKVVRENV
jgi:uncharacterized RDD family membrane protein YckC